MRTQKYFRIKIPRWRLLLMVISIFSLESTAAQGLDDYKWKNRLVFLVDNAIESKEIQDQLKLFRNSKEEMAERDLILFTANETTIVDDDKNNVKITIADLRKAARIDADFKGVLLLGKDGGCKLKTAFQIGPKEIFDLIDNMPMRRAEIKSARDKYERY